MRPGKSQEAGLSWKFSPILLYVAGSLFVVASTVLVAGSLGAWLLLHAGGSLVALVMALRGWAPFRFPGGRMPVAFARLAIRIVAAGVILLLVCAFLIGGKPPLIRALTSNSFDFMFSLRSDYLAPYPGLSFALRMAVHGAIPALMLYFLQCESRRAFLLFAVPIALMIPLLLYKSMVVVVHAPLALSALTTRARALLICVVSGMLLLLVAQVVATNPHLRGYRTVSELPGLTTVAVAAPETGAPKLELAQSGSTLGLPESALLSLHGLVERAAVRVGEGSAAWLALVPTVIPYNHGCAVRRIAWILGCPHVDMPAEIYARLYPDYVGRGQQGSVDVPHFVQDYAMFGPLGLFLSGMIATFALMIVRNSVPFLHPAYFLSILMIAFVTSVPEILLSEGGLLTCVLLVLINRVVEHHAPRGHPV